MPVRIVSAGGGGITLSAASTGSEFGLTLPATNGALGINLGTAQNSTSGTAIDFTGIPASARRVTVMFSGVSTSGTSSVLLQAGTSLGLQTSSYLGTVNDGDAAATNQQFSTGFSDNTSSAAIVRHGVYELCLLTGNTWACRFQIGFSNAAAVRQGAGSITLSGALDRVRITTVGGTDTFDAGSINIAWEI